MSGWAAETLVATSLLLVAVLLLRVPVARLFGAKAAYLLWLAPLLRLVWPPAAAPAEAPLPVIIETVAGGPASLAGAAAPAGGDLGGILLIYWLGGAALFLAGQLYLYRRFLRGALEDATPVGEAGIDHAAVLETDQVAGPCATGLLVRRIFVPRGFARSFGTEERRLALAHEALHHRRGDLWASAAALVVLALHWWNPLAYLAHRAFRLDMEAACDADLVREAGEHQRVAYAETLLRCVARPLPQPTCALTTIKELKGRLTMLSLHHGNARRRAGIALAGLLTAGSLAAAAPGVAREPVAAPVALVSAVPVMSAPVAAAPAAPQPVLARVASVTAAEAVPAATAAVLAQQPAAPTPPTPPTPPADAGKGEKRIERVVVLNNGAGLPADMRTKIRSCEGQTFEFKDERGQPATGQERTRILLCAKGGKAEAATAMERALTRIRSDSNLPEEVKARVVSALEARIAELKRGS